tara:strand:+ start:33 stop:263 length:231 start_codon:yes stop_codon:yes gene_type:complete
MTKEENYLDGLFEELTLEPNKEIRFMGYRDVIQQFKDQISEAKNNNNFQDFVIYSRILGDYKIKMARFEMDLINKT